MKYVLDASVALKWVLPEKDTPRAVRLRNEYRQKIHQLLAPDIFTAEIGQALAKAERKRIIHPPEGERRLAIIHRTPPQFHPYMTLTPRAFRIASAHRVAFYDCLYLALAERERCELVTADDRFLK